MAASDYEFRGAAGLTPFGLLGGTIDCASTTLVLSKYVQVSDNDLQVGMGVLIGNEIARLDAFDIENKTFSVARGCADTIPVPHTGGERVWFFSRNYGYDNRQYLSSDIIGVKLLNRSLRGEVVPITKATPMTLTMRNRHARPYPPADLTLNAVSWYQGPLVVDGGTANVTLTWKNRNRLTQADQLLGLSDGNMTPESGQTCYLIVKRANGDVVGTTLSITGTTTSVSRIDLVSLLGSDDVSGRIVFGSIRDGVKSWQEYDVPFSLSSAGAASQVVVSESSLVLN